jgi:hypothetical protein
MTSFQKEAKMSKAQDHHLYQQAKQKYNKKMLAMPI